MLCWRRGAQPTTSAVKQMETEEFTANTNRERKFGPSWIFLVFLVIFTAYALMLIR